MSPGPKGQLAIFREAMPPTEEVKERIERALPGARATVTDLTGGGDHLRAEVAYEGFAGLSRVQQHKLVYDVFGDEIGGPIHALSLKTTTPDGAA
jgi:stress-induced morphogen